MWNRLCSEYPDILAKCELSVLRGKDGRKGHKPTPVSDKEGTLYIIGLLPGAVGKTYREQAAKLVLRYLDADITPA